jgi:hypothetical protein
MKLDTFRIINCFGFGDSGSVDLRDSENLIYILGRNSSGKSSFLNAVRCFGKGVIPQEWTNFENFERSSEQSRFEGHFTFDEIDEATFVKQFSEHLENVTFGDQHRSGHPPNAKLVDGTTALYQELIKELNKSKNCVVWKYPDGDYLFLSPDFESSKPRLDEVRRLIKAATNTEGLFHSAGAWRNVKLDEYTAENILFNQFPQIVLFGQYFALSDSLPKTITKDWNSKSSNGLTKSFIQFLGSQQINELLNSKVPSKVSHLQNALNERAAVLARKINSGTRNENNSLLDLEIMYTSEGLQLTVYADKKPSFYSQLSDNTKFLFAYHLHQSVSGIEGRVLLFDEPSNGFHPTAQRQLLNFLQNLSRSGNQVLVSTHSEYLIDPQHLSGVRIMSSDADQKLVVRNRFYNAGKVGDYFALQPVFDAIGHEFSKQLGIKDKIVITEGVTDLLYIMAFAKILKREIPSIAPARGDGQIAHLLSFMIAQGFRTKIVIDKGQVREKLQKDFGIADQFVHEIDVPARWSNTIKTSGIEDAFSKNDFRQVLKTIDHTTPEGYMATTNSAYVKGLSGDSIKRLLAHAFHENARNLDRSNFEEETIRNFEDLLEFCKADEWFSI